MSALGALKELERALELARNEVLTFKAGEMKPTTTTEIAQGLLTAAKELERIAQREQE